MIATLSGIVSEKLPDQVVLEVNGVGYGLLVPADDYTHLEVGEEARLLVYEYIREQAHDLFGFISRDTKLLFEKLLEVNGVGPKMALSMLSIGSSDALRQAIASGDVAFIQQATGVGKRLAERVVVELKDKVGLIGVDLQTTGMMQAEAQAMGDEAIEALIALGYTLADATKALKDVDSSLPTEDRVTIALKGVKK
jgi:Holliday junction DNA helicase RuvA